MKINTLKMSLFAVAAVFSLKASARMVEYFEDAYTQQAPQELTAQVEQVAQKIGFDKDYQVVVPKKPGLQINPWNKLVTSGINPQNKLPFVLINQEWFKTLDQEQQTFLVARNLITAEAGPISLGMKLLPWIWMLVSLSLMVLCFFALKRTRFANKPVWMKIVGIYLFFVIGNFTFLKTLYNKINIGLAQRYDHQIVQMTLAKTSQDMQVALDTFKKMDDFVKKELNEGDTFWKPFENTFADLVERLK